MSFLVRDYLSVLEGNGILLLNFFKVIRAFFFQFFKYYIDVASLVYFCKLFVFCRVLNIYAFHKMCTINRHLPSLIGLHVTWNMCWMNCLMCNANVWLWAQCFPLNCVWYSLNFFLHKFGQFFITLIIFLCLVIVNFRYLN